MPLLGQGAMMFWHDIDADEEDYNHWHTFEHMPERVGIPGFRRGRRYVATDGGPTYFNMYETESPATLTSAAYLARLNDPTPWSKRTLPRFKNSNRSLCSVRVSAGKGVGGALLTLEFSPREGAAAELRHYLGRQAAELVTQPGIVGAHLLEADEASSKLQTAEKSLRDVADEVADQVLLVEALDRELLLALREKALTDSALMGIGVGEIQNIAFYRLLHVLSEVELA